MVHVAKELELPSLKHVSGILECGTRERDENLNSSVCKTLFSFAIGRFSCFGYDDYLAFAIGS